MSLSFETSCNTVAVFHKVTQVFLFFFWFSCRVQRTTIRYKTNMPFAKNKKIKKVRNDEPAIIKNRVSRICSLEAAVASLVYHAKDTLLAADMVAEICAHTPRAGLKLLLLRTYVCFEYVCREYDQSDAGQSCKEGTCLKHCPSADCLLCHGLAVWPRL